MLNQPRAILMAILTARGNRMGLADDYDGREYAREKNTHCTARCEVFSRVCGFMRPVQVWNPGKKAEFHDRRPFDIHRIPVETQS